MRRALAVFTAASTVTAALTLACPQAPAYAAVDPPGIDPSALPPAGDPSPEQAMQQTFKCVPPLTVADPDVKLPAPGSAMLNLPAAWQFSTGAGISVGVIDTGVQDSQRVHAAPGGDYVTGEGGPSAGLEDCEGHGTVVASIIAGQPADPAHKPPARPENAPAAPPPPAPPGQGAPITPAPEPPKPVTVTVQTPPPPPPRPAPPPPADDSGPAPAAYVPAGDQPVQPAAGGGWVSPVDAPPPPPPPPAPADDAFIGVAPDASIISIRQSSQAFSPVRGGVDPDGRIKKAGDLMTLARAIRRMADLGVRVINLSVQSCMSANDLINDAPVGAALNYAAIDKDIVVVAAAGNTGEEGTNCGQNPVFDPLRADDPRDWHQVSTVVTPAWYSSLVLTVGAVDAGPDANGAPLPESIAGPWVRVAAPGKPIIGLAGPDGHAVNARPNRNKPGETAPLWGTSFAAPYVSGVAALVRAKYPDLSAAQVIRRIVETAHHPARGVDNQVGYGVVDPLLALTADVDAGPRVDVSALAQRIPPPAPTPPVDTRPRTFALVGTALVVAAAAAAVGSGSLRRKPRNK